VQREVILPVPDDGVGEQAGTGEGRSIGNSGGGAWSTWGAAPTSRPLSTNLGLRTRTTTSEAGRRSTVSVVSSPMRTNASVPFC